MPQPNLAFTVDDDGKVTFVYHPNDTQTKRIMALLGSICQDQRAGYVWPLNFALRTAFRLLRKMFGNRGKVADWTRTWHCRWGVWDAETMSQLPYSYPTHLDAVTAEIEWSLQHGFPKHIIGGAS